MIWCWDVHPSAVKPILLPVSPSSSARYIYNWILIHLVELNNYGEAVESEAKSGTKY